MKSVFDNVKAILGIAPIAQATATESLSAAIDTMGYGDAMVEVLNGAATGTPDSYSIACKVYECATSGGSYTEVSGATASLTANGTSAQIRVAGLGTSRQRYLKVGMTPTIVGGSTPKCLISAAVLLGGADTLPVDNSSTAA